MITLPEYIRFTDDAGKMLQSVLREASYDKATVLVDENTATHCLPLLDIPKEVIVIEIQSGEKNKHLGTCEKIWKEMTESGFTRKSLLINLGGGVIGDMGGFAAATFKRGIPFINIPTTLLSQVDASVGGKLGVDFNGFKNHIGVFQEPEAVIISDKFLKTLPAEQLRSGFAEVIKHGLIWDREYFEKVTKVNFPNEVDWSNVLRRSVEIKQEVVQQDPKENGLRKILNFGHTLGHAIETWHLNHDKPMLHGEAIAIGMIMEGYLSLSKGWISPEQLNLIETPLLRIFGKVKTTPPLPELEDILIQDKKNEQGLLNFSVLKNIGQCEFDVRFNRTEIVKAIDYYNRLDK